MPKKTCRGFFVDPETLAPMTDKQVDELIKCIPNRNGVPMYYKYNKKEGRYDFLAYHTKASECYENRKKGQHSMINLPTCQASFTESINPDYHAIQKYLLKIREKGQVEKEYIMNMISSYKNKFKQEALDRTEIARIEKDVKDSIEKIRSSSQILLSEHVYDFIEDLLLYTDITFVDLKEILNGAHTMVRGDKGYFYRKYKNPYIRRYIDDDGNERTEKVIPKYKVAYDKNAAPPFSPPSSSHLSKEPEQLRLGAGTLYSCDDDKCTSERFDLLVGTSTFPETEGDTWFQFEYFNCATITNNLLHLYAYVLHVKSGYKNIGPFGASLYSEKKNYILQLDLCKPIVGNEEPSACVHLDNVKERERKREIERSQYEDFLSKKEVKEILDDDEDDEKMPFIYMFTSKKSARAVKKTRKSVKKTAKRSKKSLKKIKSVRKYRPRLGL